MLTIYHNPRCAKSRETLKIIQDSGQEVKVIEYLKTPPAITELKEILTKLGINAEALVRKGEAAYKENFKGKALSEEEWLQALVDYPKLIERPIVIKGDQAVIGRPPENVKAVL